MKQQDVVVARRRKTQDKPVEESPQAKSFNRGQTISSYKKENSERQQARLLIRYRRKLMSVFGMLLALAGLAFFLLAQLVVSVKVSSSAKLPTDKANEYAQHIIEYYENHPIERLKIFLDDEKMLAFLKSKSPEIENIKSLEKDSLFSATAEIEFRQPVASWDSGARQLFVDSHGVAFSQNFYGNPNLMIVDESGAKVSGNVIASNNFLNFIGKMISLSSQKNLKVTKITIPPLSLRQIEVRFENLEYPVKFMTNLSAEEQVSGLESSVNYLQKHGVSPQYLDLRVAGRAYYK